MQLILEANDIYLSTAHFIQFKPLWEKVNLCENYGNTTGVKGLKNDTCHS